MNAPALSLENARLRLKEPSGWFAAGYGFRKALTLLSDGAFQLFAYLCLEANRRTGRVEATQKELAVALGKSKRSIGTHVDELQAHQVCKVFPANNQYARTVFEIADDFWPYHRSDHNQSPSEERMYIDSVREFFLSLGCASGRFSAADEQTAKHMYHRAIPLAVIENGMLLGACRKYISWLNNGQAWEPIQGLAYFERVIAEIQAQPLPPGYAGYLRRKIRELAAAAQNCRIEASSEFNMTVKFGGTCTSTPPPSFINDPRAKSFVKGANSGRPGPEASQTR